MFFGVGDGGGFAATIPHPNQNRERNVISTEGRNLIVFTGNPINSKI